MKLKFVDQSFQNEAVNSVVDVFKGTTKKNSIFTIDVSQGITTRDLVNIFEQNTTGVDRFQGYGNKLDLTPNELLKNIHDIQLRNNILKSTYSSHKNYAIDMETGTGKTYVYTKTILELNAKYGFTKFIIVVPSIAIKEGVFQSLRATQDHFKNRYQNIIYRYFIYNSSSLNEIYAFATSTNIEIMIINIDSFKKSFENIEEQNKANIIHRPSDTLSGNKPIDLVSSTNPVVIIDEPQSVLIGKGNEAIESLNPLCTIRYSATHRKSESNSQHLLYRLTPVDAYNKKLVKQIEVVPIRDQQNVYPYIKINKIYSKKGIKASIDIFKINQNSLATKTTIEVGQDSDLYELSGWLNQYQNSQYRVQEIRLIEDDPKESYVKFGHSLEIKVGETFGADNENQMKKAMISATIRSHLEQEKKLLGKNIKVLSLFFIDRVHNYRQYGSGQAKKGQYAIWFEEAYQELIEHDFKDLVETNKNLINFDVTVAHGGYFSQDKKDEFKDTRGDTADDESTYEKIMKEKEKLLGFKEPLRFIFSHSALKEGWDNPNIFQICTLVETKDTMTKRQKIGRGLRLCVNQDGERNLEEKNNVLRVIANESYSDFVSKLQTELEEELGYKIGVIEPISFTGISFRAEYEEVETILTQDDSVKIFESLKINGYINQSGKVQETFYKDLKINDQAIKLPKEYSEIYCASKIISKIKELSRELGIKNANERIKISNNKNVLLSQDFMNAWNKISSKTIYSIDIKLNEFITMCTNKIKLMPKIKENKFIVEYWRIKMPEKVSQISMMLKEGQAKSSYSLEIKDSKLIYPDLIRRLMDATGLKRQTIVRILNESQRLEDFKFNHEDFITQVSKLINDTKKQFMTDTIKYEKSSELYVAEDIFDDEDLFAYEKNTLVPANQGKTVFDHIIYDSVVEKDFAREADNDDRVVLYAKLPSRFVIQTPWGTYNPDWMLVMYDEKNKKKLYFVTETKGTLDENERSIQQNAKILCGRKHFEVVDNELKYLVAVKLADLNP